MPMTQLQMWRAAEKRSADLNNVFMEMVRSPTNPLTREDLHALLKKRPDTYGRFAGFIDKLPSRSASPTAECPRCASVHVFARNGRFACQDCGHNFEREAA